jgi:alpha-N-arabinofuranosidase
VKALKAINIPLIRWPGGCFADEYHWKDGIGPKEERAEMINTHWGGVIENNHFGTHEFFDFCEQIGAEPYICGNVGSGTVQEMSEWVEYMTFAGKSPMTDLRKKNGRASPWKLKYFGIGNENWNCGGRMTAEYYADRYMNFNLYCRNYGDNVLYRIACGPRYDNYHWTEVMMKKCVDFMDGLSLHYYTHVKDTSKLVKMDDGNIRYLRNPVRQNFSATQFDKAEWDMTMRATMFMEELVTKHSAIMDKYDPEKKVALIVDEWGASFSVEPGTNPGFLYQQNTLRDALVAGLHFNIFNSHADRVRMTNIAQTINVLQAIILTEGSKMILTPTYHVFYMFKVHQDAALLDFTMLSDDYAADGKTFKQVSASASKGTDGKINITLCNIDPDNGAKVDCVLDTIPANARVSGTVLTSGAMNTHNTFDNPEAIKPVPFSGFTVDKNRLCIDLPSRSVTLITIG